MIVYVMMYCCVMSRYLIGCVVCHDGLKSQEERSPLVERSHEKKSYEIVIRKIQVGFD